MAAHDEPWVRPLHNRRYFGHEVLHDAFPETGVPARAAYDLLHTGLMLNGRETLNLASFVTTWMEPEADQLIMDAIRTNHIDHEEYPASQLMEELCVRALAALWNAPSVDDAVGVATIGSSEAIMLGLLAHKWTWKKKREAAGLPTDKPNIVFGAETHIVWDKFARYFDVEMRKIPMKPDRYVFTVDEVLEQIDENTIAVGAVLGTTFIGEVDPIEELNDALVALEADKGWDVPIHVDGASGGFVAPFSDPDERWDFRLDKVASINASGHKYGLVYPGVGWLVFRDKAWLPEDLVFSVNYLGGAQPTYTFNFSRGSAMIQAQLYNFLRLGREGYTDLVQNMLANARFLNEALEATGRFEIMNPKLAEPVVTFKLTGDPPFDVYHLSERLRQDGWIVPAYSLPPDAEDVHLLRVVVRVEMSHQLLGILVADIQKAYDELEADPPSHTARRTPDPYSSPRAAGGRTKARVRPTS